MEKIGSTHNFRFMRKKMDSKTRLYSLQIPLDCDKKYILIRREP